MARTKQAARKGAKKVITVSESLEGKTKSELLKMGKGLGLFGDITVKNISRIAKDDMILQIIDAQATSSEVSEIMIGEEKPVKKAGRPKTTATKKPTKKPAKKPAKKVIPKKKIAPTVVSAKTGYETKAVSTLLKLCKERGIKACSGKKSMLKKNIIPLLEEWDAAPPKKVVKKKMPAKKVKVAKKKMPAKKVKVAKKKTTPVAKVKIQASSIRKMTAGCGPHEILVLDTVDKCIKKTKAGIPYGETALRKKYGDEYFYDAELGVVGRKDEVDAYRRETKKGSTKGKVAKKATRCDDPDEACDDRQVCKTSTGKCVADTAAARKGAYILTVDDRILIGNKKTLETLQGILGGDITPPTKVAGKVVAGAKKKKTPIKETSDIEERLGKLLEEEVDETEIAEMRKKLVAVKKKKTPVKKQTPKKKTPVKPKTQTPAKPTSFKVDLKKQEIFDTFQKCLASLQAQ